MKSLLLLFPALVPFLTIGQTLVSTDFGNPERYRPLPENHPAHITGSLPEGVIEDSGWAGITTHYAHEKNPLGGDLGWLNISLSGGEKGQAQLKWELPPLDAPAKYRLVFTGASPDNSTFTFAIRDGGPPWAAHWEKTIVPGGFMNQQSFDFTLPALGEGKMLILHMGRRGAFQLQDVKLIRRDPAELAREREQKLANAPDNLLPVTGFPLGLPPLWSIGNRMSWDLDIRVEASESPSPRGTVPLRLATRREGIHADLWSAPFEPLIREEPHTLSFYYKGILVDGSVDIRFNRETLVRENLLSSPAEWKRVSLTFTPDPIAKFHVVHWSVQGDIEIDSLMLSVGSEVKPFRLSETAEVVLSADRKKNHVIVDGVDAPEFRAAVTGAPEGARLELLAVNLTGESQTLPAISLQGEAVEIHSVSIKDLFPDAPYGPFRIEGRVVQEGEAITPPTDLVLYHLRKPRLWGKNTFDSPFGGHFHVHEPHLYSAKAIGQNWNRLHGDNGKWTYWSGVEPRKGEWTFHHERMQAMRAAGFSIMGVWVHCPGWARVERQEPNGWLDNWWQPRDYNEFATYVDRVTREYKDTIRHWQIWNEPWGEFWFKEWRPELGPLHQWHAGPDPEGDYVRLSRMAYQAGKEADPDIHISGIHATIGDKGKRWMKKMLDRDAETATDSMSFHAYGGGQLSGLLSDSPEQLQDRLNRYILDPVREKKSITRKPELWLTEGNVIGSKNNSGGGLYRHSFILDPEPVSLLVQDAQLLSVYHLVCFAMSVDRIFVYAQNAVESSFTEKVGLWWGALGINGGELNPSAAVYAAMTWHLEGADFQKRLLLDDVHAFVFQRGDTAVAALIAPAPRAEAWTPPANNSLTWRDHLGNNTRGPFTFGTLVWVERPGTAAELTDILTSDL